MNSPWAKSEKMRFVKRRKVLLKNPYKTNKYYKVVKAPRKRILLVWAVLSSFLFSFPATTKNQENEKNPSMNVKTFWNKIKTLLRATNLIQNETVWLMSIQLIEWNADGMQLNRVRTNKIKNLKLYRMWCTNLILIKM